MRKASAYFQAEFPTRFDELQAYGNTLIRQGNHGQAREAYSRLKEMNPAHPAGNSGLATLSMQEGNYEEALAIFQEMNKRFPGNRWWMPQMIKAMRLLGRDAEASALLEEDPITAGNPLATAALLTQNTLASADKAGKLLAKHDLPDDLRELCKKILVHKAATYERIKNFDYKIISLGRGCLPANLASRWALSDFVSNESRRLPFDLGWHQDDAVTSLLHSDFASYSTPGNIDTYLRDDNVVCFKLKSPLVHFNHDPVINYDKNKDNFLNTLQERAENFRQITSTRPVLFIHHVIGSVSRNVIENFRLFLSKLNVQHKLLIIATGDNDGFEVSDNISIFKIKSYANFDKFWLPENLLSVESFEFEKKIVDKIASIIEGNFGRKITENVFNVEDVNNALNRRVIHEIADEYNVKEYINELRSKISVSKHEETVDQGGLKTGAIVMNCNPFTHGHRYLIEQASSKVDRLIIFVVEEDLSYFKFADRYRLVCAGTADLKNVVIVRSGKFIISTVTFPSYFTKANPDLAKFDASKDMDFFGLYIAPALNITIRFVGTEPTCQITNAYNRQMADALPRYGIAVEEIPRKGLGGQAISASRVREYLKAGQLDKVRELVPSTTYAYLLGMNQADIGPS